MCNTAICAICNKKSWTGCGQHIPEIMDRTPKSSWCTCEPADNTEKIFIEGHGNYPPRATTGNRRGSTTYVPILRDYSIQI
ncbi:hypothetical protein JA1_003116 [Spathaspora sp. JA1]|nr:hypothetical protein JA1_003116 [Spathaspora sp. JA1]